MEDKKTDWKLQSVSQQESAKEVMLHFPVSMKLGTIQGQECLGLFCKSSCPEPNYVVCLDTVQTVDTLVELLTIARERLVVRDGTKQ